MFENYLREPKPVCPNQWGEQGFFLFFLLLLGFTPWKAEQPLRGMVLQEKKHKKDYSIPKICLERTYS